MERSHGAERIWPVRKEKEGEKGKERKEGKEKEVECKTVYKLD